MQLLKKELKALICNSPTLPAMVANIRKFYAIPGNGCAVELREVSGHDGVSIAWHNGVHMLRTVVIKSGARYSLYHTPDAWRDELADAVAP